MAHIEDTLCPHFSGHVGPVRFRRGHAETDDAELVAYFALQPERYAVTETDEPRGDNRLPGGMPCEDCEQGLADCCPEDDDPQE